MWIFQRGTSADLNHRTVLWSWHQSGHCWWCLPTRIRCNCPGVGKYQVGIQIPGYESKVIPEIQDRNQWEIYKSRRLRRTARTFWRCHLDQQFNSRDRNFKLIDQNLTITNTLSCNTRQFSTGILYCGTCTKYVGGKMVDTIHSQLWWMWPQYVIKFLTITWS